MADPRSEFWELLTPSEKLGCLVGERFSESPLWRAYATAHQSSLTVPILGLTINDRSHLIGWENVPAHRSLILAANHRTYFDLYAVMIITWWRYPKLPWLYCPVRTGFFYERPLGVLFNATLTCNAMYPPVFRDARRRTLNRYAVDRARQLLHMSPRVVIAIHPEGRRNPAEDPLDFLPPKRGVGAIALASHAPIVPVFVNGLPRTFGALVRQRLSGQGPPVRVHCGPPVAVDDLYDRPEDGEAQLEASRRTMAAIAALGAQDKAWMAARG